MNDLENKNTSTVDADSWQQHCATLQKQISTLLIALVVLSGTLTFYLFRQYRFTKAGLEAAKLNIVPAMQAFSKNDKPLMDGFIVKLVEFGRTHPDFLKVVAAHGIQLPSPPAAQPVVTPPPAPPAPKATVPAAVTPQKK